MKGSALVEFLAHQSIENYQPMQLEFPDEDIMALFEEKEEEGDEEESWSMVFDGASNALGHGIRVVLISPEK